MCLMSQDILLETLIARVSPDMFILSLVPVVIYKYTYSKIVFPRGLTNQINLR